MIWLPATIVTFVTAALLHCLAKRLRPELNTVILFCALGGIGGAILLLLITQIYGLAFYTVLAAITFYAFMCELYIFLITFVIGSISVWILLTHLNSNFATAFTEQSPADCAAMTNQRLDRMVQTKLLSYSNGVYKLTPKGRLIMILLLKIVKFFHHSESAFKSDFPHQ